MLNLFTWYCCIKRMIVTDRNCHLPPTTSRNVHNHPPIGRRERPDESSTAFRTSLEGEVDRENSEMVVASHSKHERKHHHRHHHHHGNKHRGSHHTHVSETDRHSKHHRY